MEITAKEWKKYIDLLSKLNANARKEFLEFSRKKGSLANIDRTELLDYVYALTTKYGEASATISAQLFDEIAEANKLMIAPATPAETLNYHEVAKTVNGSLKVSLSEDYIAGVVGQMVKQASADTILQNSIREGCQFAWIPAGDTCAFCLALAANGWQYASKDTVKHGHAEHIHANCDCTYGIKFSSRDRYDFYKPEVYKQMYDNADGKTPSQKINALRRENYQKNKEEIREQKRMAYASKKKREAVE